MRGTSRRGHRSIDLVIEDHWRVDTVYFLMSEDNVRLGHRASPGSASAPTPSRSAPEGVFLKSSTHPRAYGNFARLLGQYVRDEKVITLAGGDPPADAPAGRRTGSSRTAAASTPAATPTSSCSTRRRSRITPRSTKPQQYATGVEHVFVNGVQVLKNGEHTGAKPGRVVRGPGWTLRRTP